SDDEDVQNVGPLAPGRSNERGLAVWVAWRARRAPQLSARRRIPLEGRSFAKSRWGADSRRASNGSPDRSFQGQGASGRRSPRGNGEWQGSARNSGDREGRDASRFGLVRRVGRSGAAARRPPIATAAIRIRISALSD